MSAGLKASDIKIKAYGFVFTKDNMPRIDNPLTVPTKDWGYLTRDQKEFANKQVPEHLRRYD